MYLLLIVRWATAITISGSCIVLSFRQYLCSAEAH